MNPLSNHPLVYVVEDESDIRELICFHLAGEGCQVEGFSHAESAQKAVDQKKPDLVVDSEMALKYNLATQVK